MDNNWFKIWPSKLRSLVSSLPNGRMRANMTMLIMIYLDDGKLPDSDPKLAFLTGLPIEDIQELRPYFEFLGRADGERLYLDFAEEVIMERVDFAEKKANAGAKRWKSTAEQKTAEDSTPKPKRAQLSSAKHSRAQLSSVKPNNTDMSCLSDSTNVLSGADALPETGSPGEKTGNRKPDPLFAEFCTQFQTSHDGEPYAHKPADFVKLAGLRDRYAKAKPQPWEVTVERFRQAAGNYFQSELATHTLADLCERFSTFFRHPLDRYNKPMGAEVSRNGNGARDGPGPPPVVTAPADYRKPKTERPNDRTDI